MTQGVIPNGHDTKRDETAALPRGFLPDLRPETWIMNGTRGHRAVETAVLTPLAGRTHETSTQIPPAATAFTVASAWDLIARHSDTTLGITALIRSRSCGSIEKTETAAIHHLRNQITTRVVNEVDRTGFAHLILPNLDHAPGHRHRLVREPLAHEHRLAPKATTSLACLILSMSFLGWSGQRRALHRSQLSRNRGSRLMTPSGEFSNPLSCNKKGSWIGLTNDLLQSSLVILICLTHIKLHNCSPFSSCPPYSTINLLVEYCFMLHLM